MRIWRQRSFAMTIIGTLLTSFLILPLFLASSVFGQEGTREPEPKSAPPLPAGDKQLPPVDTAQLLAKFSEQPAHLLAPDVTAFQVTLPPTTRPAQPSQHDGAASSCNETGYIQPAPPDILAFAPWSQAKIGGQVCRVELTSAHATGLRVQLQGEFGADGLELRVYDPVSEAVFGPYSSPPLADGQTWWTTVIFGDTIGLEFYLPSGAPIIPERLPKIHAIAYLYTDFASAFQTCRTDLMCNADWDDSIEQRAIGYMLYNCSPTSCGQCTGALFNRDPQDFAPIFMTARHCITNQQAAQSLTIIWFYQTDSCNGTIPALNTLMRRNSGCLLLRTRDDSDWSLVGLCEPAQTDIYLGWDPNYWNNNETATGIHHPLQDGNL